MSFVSCLNDDDAVLALDASVVVNLNATECAEQIIETISNPCVVTRNVLAELELGEACGYSDASQLKILVESELVRVVELSDAMRSVYLHLVSGTTADTLDDGEAATLAYAHGDGVWAAIDERKALRICSEQFPNLKTTSTVDMLAERTIEESLSRPMLAKAAYNALTNARMRVFAHQVDWIVDLLGSERAKHCSSLPRRYRAGL